MASHFAPCLNRRRLSNSKSGRGADRRHKSGVHPSIVLSCVCEVFQMNNHVVSRDGTWSLPAIATCLSDALDGSVIGVFGHGSDVGDSCLT